MAAVANAIYDAVGVRMTDLPMSPPKVLAALDVGEPLMAKIIINREIARQYTDGQTEIEVTSENIALLSEAGRALSRCR